MILKGLPLNVLKNAGMYGDCTCDGISSRYNKVVLVDPKNPDFGYCAVDMSNPPENVVLIHKRVIDGKEYLSLQPIDSCHIKSEFNHGEQHWYSAGGNFAYSSDSRYCEYCEYPLPIHDRKEW